MEKFAQVSGNWEVQAREFAERLAEAERTNQRLLAEVAESNHKLAETQADLRRANLDLEQFAFSVSHALREPLRNLAIHSQLLRRKELALDEEAAHWLAVVLGSAERMEALFRDLVAFIQAGRTAPSSETDPNLVLEHVLTALEETIRQGGATVKTEPLPCVSMSDQHLFQVFRNLLENAVRYSAPGVPPQIHIDWHPAGEEAVICVRDNGIGIDVTNQERVFELFKRLHTGDNHDGTGLGLAMCQKLVEQHGGRIWVESKPGQGAVFCFQLPRGANERKSRAAISA